MSIQFNRNTKTIKEVVSMFEKENLFVDNGYQRKKVWSPQDNVRFIETILMEMVIPEIFFWIAEINPDTGEAMTHIVDGQQRLSAITDYIDGKYVLTKRYLTNSQMVDALGDCSFSNLPPEYKSAFWQYPLPLVVLDNKYDKQQIVEIFRRLNLTEYSLNAQERRHSEEDNAFGKKCESLAENDFWEKRCVFSAADSRRMRDVTYCCSIYILCADGIIDQTDNTAIQRFYEDYAEAFDEDAAYTKDILDAMDVIDYFAEAGEKFISKKAQLYTLFSLAFYLQDHQVKIDEAMREHFRLFVMAYDLFKNEFEIGGLDDEAMQSYEAIKRYKLASSEGVNKGANRTIRFNVLKDVCLGKNNDEGYKALISRLTDMELERQHP